MTLPRNRPQILHDCKTLYSRRLTEVLREIEVISFKDAERVAEGARRYFDDAIETAKRGSSFTEEAHGLTSSQLTLVTDDDLELSIRLDSLAMHLYEASSGWLWKPYLRFTTLLDRPDLPKEDNPIAPLGLVHGLEEMFAADGCKIAIDSRDALLDQLEALLTQKLPEIYREIDTFLSDDGIEAGQANILTTPNRANAGQPGDLVGTLAALNQALVARLPAGSGGSGGGGSGGGHAAAAGKGGKGGERSAPQAPSGEQLRQRINALDQQEQKRPGKNAPTGDGSSTDLANLIPGLFDDKSPGVKAPPKMTSATLGIPPETPEGLLVDLLASIFDALLADNTWPPGLHSAIQLLRTTIVKQALLEKTPITDPKNSCRQIIDSLGTIFRGIPPNADPRQAICTRVFSISSKLRQQYDNAPDAFPKALGGLETMIEDRSHDIERQLAAYLPVIKRLEENDDASKLSAQALAKVRLHDVPDEIRFFFDDIWKPVLQKACLQYGHNSPEWKAYCSVIDDFLWSLKPDLDEFDQRALSFRIPQVLKQIRAGMEFTQQPPEIQSQVLNICFALQARATRPGSVKAALPSMPTPSKTTSPRDVLLRNVRAGERSLQSVDYREAGQPAPSSLACQQGDWLSLSVGKRQHVFCVAHITPSATRALLLNPELESPLAIHLGILEAQLRQGEARIQSRTSLFESAANGALSGFQA